MTVSTLSLWLDFSLIWVFQFLPPSFESPVPRFPVQDHGVTFCARAGSWLCHTAFLPCCSPLFVRPLLSQPARISLSAFSFFFSARRFLGRAPCFSPFVFHPRLCVPCVILLLWTLCTTPPIPFLPVVYLFFFSCPHPIPQLLLPLCCFLIPLYP